MSENQKKKYIPGLISPVPHRLSQNSENPLKKNPFVEFPPIKTPGLPEEDVLQKELSQILSRNSIIFPPIAKKTPSPSFLHKIDRPPTRQKENPLVFDEIFIELNSCLSTCESLTELTK